MRETNPAEVIIGVDTHKHIHAAAAINALGARLGTLALPASRKGYQELEAWARSFGPVRAFGIEGTGPMAQVSRAVSKRAATLSSK